MTGNGVVQTMPLAPVANSDGMLGGGAGSWIWILLIFLFLGNGRGLGFGNDGVAVSPATNLINNDFLYTQQKIDNLGQGLINQTNQINQNLCTGFNGINAGIANLGYQMSQCCCEVNRNIDQTRFENARNTCDITTAIGASTQAIKDLINSNSMQDLRDRNVELYGALNNCNQTAAFSTMLNSALNTRFPYPVPASVVGYGYPGFGPAYGAAPFGFGHHGHQHQGHDNCGHC